MNDVTSVYMSYKWVVISIMIFKALVLIFIVCGYIPLLLLKLMQNFILESMVKAERLLLLLQFSMGRILKIIILPPFYLSDGRDFNGPSPAILIFPASSIPGNLQCIAITLMYDNDAEATENLIVELRSNDSAVIVPASGNVVIINIRDMPNPFGK